MGITGARWGLEGAQAILWLRAIRANGDLDTYWDWHITQEHHRNHLSRYQQRPRTRRMTSLEKSHTHVTSSWFAREGGSSTFTPSVTFLNTQPKAGIASRGMVWARSSPRRYCPYRGECLIFPVLCDDRE